MKQTHSMPFFLIVNLFILLPLSTARDIITPSQPLTDNETLISSDGLFALGFFTPPNSNNRYIGLWYNQIPDHSILWVANRVNPLTNSTGVLSVTTDGRLTITGRNSTVVWSTNATGLSSPVAQLLKNGNLVIKQDGDNNGNYAWQGFDYPTDTLIPGMKLGVDLTTGINHTGVAWNSYNDPSPGPYRVLFDIKGVPEVCIYEGSSKIWRSVLWHGIQFDLILRMAGFDRDLVLIKDQVATFSYRVTHQIRVSKFIVNSMGIFKFQTWQFERNKWNDLYVVPNHPCDNFGKCGPYGFCDPNSPTVCTCLQGFIPKNKDTWNIGDFHDGCVRETGLDCLNRTDGFAIMSSVKLPQSDSCTVKLGLRLDECKGFCLQNCSCTAYAIVNLTADGSGCVIWTDQLIDIRSRGIGNTLHIRLAAANIGILPVGLPHSKGNTAGRSCSRGRATIVIVLVPIAGVLLLTFVGYLLWREKKKRGAIIRVKKQYDHGPGRNELDVPLFDFRTIAAATNSFSDVNKLGHGGFGPVYKGNLGEGQEIAIKRLAKTSLQGVEEFKNEVMLIAKLQHKNLVRLLGCCIQDEERILIYEYMPNGSLDAFLFDKDKGALLDWKTRYQIIMGITRGLLYLHHDSRFRIIHRDLKASNILLDNAMNPKISDFGTARIFGGDETAGFNTRKVVGTYGYMSPEYAMGGVFSMKSDVFSFGVVLLEIISGRKNRGEYTFSPHLNLLAHAWSLWNEGRSLQLVHESMGDYFPVEEALKCIKVGLLCVQERPEDRPLMSSVGVMFGKHPEDLPMPKQPGFIACTTPSESDMPLRNQESSASNHLTVSLYGR